MGHRVTCPSLQVLCVGLRDAGRRAAFENAPRPANSFCCNSGRLLRTERRRGNGPPTPASLRSSPGEDKWLCRVNDKKKKIKSTLSASYHLGVALLSPSEMNFYLVY